MAVKAGSQTTEYKEAKSAGLWGVITIILGALISVGGAIGQSFGVDSKTGIIVGGLVTTAGVVQKTLASLGYIKSRTDVKTTE